MRKYILLLLVFGLNTTYAECSMNAMSFLPKNKDISLNSMFIIEGYMSSQITINGFQNRKVFLKSESGELILLSLQEILVGQMYLTQAIFKPVTPLKPNTKYFLKYDNQTQFETSEMKQWNKDTSKMEEIYWKTSDVKFLNLIDDSFKIKYEKNEVESFGCGPSSNAVFNVENKNVEIWYKTEVIEIATNNKTVFYLTEWENKLNVGHGMCAGAFTFKKTGKYKVRFSPMNTDGEFHKTTEWVVFESPYAKN